MIWSAAVGALFAAPGGVNAYWRMSCSIIQEGRIDPVISYGSASSHVHKLSGAASKCSFSTLPYLHLSTINNFPCDITNSHENEVRRMTALGRG
jgi:hypothetical protein